MAVAMALHTTEAIIIGNHDLGEVDRIVVFYTRKLGKVRAVASGARRPRSRYGAALLLFNYGRLVLFERKGKGLHRVNEFGILRPFHRIRTNLDLLAHASYLIELIATTTPDEERNEELFQLLLDSLGLLEEGLNPLSLTRAFEIRLLRAIGYLPELQCCVICRFPLELHGPLAFSPGEGGLLCRKCEKGRRDVQTISPDALSFLRTFLKVSLERLFYMEVPEGLQEELEETLQAYLRYFLHRDLRSLGFLHACRIFQGSI